MGKWKGRGDGAGGGEADIMLLHVLLPLSVLDTDLPTRSVEQSQLSAPSETCCRAPLLTFWVSITGHTRPVTSSILFGTLVLT